jgi:hypothetical protein
LSTCENTSLALPKKLTLTRTLVGNSIYLLESTTDRLSRVDSSQTFTRVVVTYLDPLIHDFHIEESLFVSDLHLSLNEHFAFADPIDSQAHVCSLAVGFLVAQPMHRFFSLYMSTQIFSHLAGAANFLVRNSPL